MFMYNSTSLMLSALSDTEQTAAAIQLPAVTPGPTCPAPCTASVCSVCSADSLCRDRGSMFTGKQGPTHQSSTLSEQS